MGILDWGLGTTRARQQAARRDHLGRYFNVLIDKARSKPGADPDLLDRIERVIEAKVRQS